MRCVVALHLLVYTALGQADQNDFVDEYRLKAAFIYNFSQFIEWPASAFVQPDSPFSICIVGRDPFGESVLALQKRNYKGRAITISYPKNSAEARACHMLYVDEARTTFLGRDLGKSLGDAPVLTISSSSDAMESGTGIGFVNQGGKIRWSLNLDAVRRGQLKVSAKLIEIAITVIGEAGK